MGNIKISAKNLEPKFKDEQIIGKTDVDTAIIEGETTTSISSSE